MPRRLTAVLDRSGARRSRRPARSDEAPQLAVLRARRIHEAVHLRELATHGKRTALEPWHADILAADPVGA